MRACVIHSARDLRVEDRAEKPPGPGEIVVEVAYGGICGSDLHYYAEGRVGDFVVHEPLTLGHEVVGRVVDHGAGTAGPRLGAAVAVHPATPCGHCAECLVGRRNICRDVRYLGSAARNPHVPGGFSERLVVPEEQVFALPEDLPLRRAVLAEPLAVALHAVGRAGDVAGRRILVTGAGPIGCLVVAALHAAKASEIIAVDLVDEALILATEVGATATVRADSRDNADWPDDVDVSIEASGAYAALNACLTHTRRGGTVVQLGLLPTGNVAVAGNLLVTREINLLGSFRFDTEFVDAIALLEADETIERIVTQTFALDEAVEAFETARDRHLASKVLLKFRDTIGD